MLCPDPLPIGVATYEAALVIAQRDRIGFYNSLIIASPIEAGRSMLLSEDMRDQRTIAGCLTIRNPFRSNEISR